MSSYLNIRKDGVRLCAYSRNTEFYGALEGMANYESWSECTAQDFWHGYDYLAEEIEKYEKAVARENAALNYLRTGEEIYNALSSIDSLKETIEEKKEALHVIGFLARMCEDEPGKVECRLT